MAAAANVEPLFSDTKGIQMMPIGRERYLTVGKWCGQTRISLRQYVRYRDGARLYPSRKGISMLVDSCIDLMFEKENISASLKKVNSGEGDVAYRRHIGRNIFVTVDSGREYVNIRQWWMPKEADQVAPSRKGICLSTDEWTKVLEQAGDVEKLVPEVQNAVPCAYRTDHSNQIGLLSCSHCSPNTCQDWKSMMA
jgi:hypothetical protein